MTKPSKNKTEEKMRIADKVEEDKKDKLKYTKAKTPGKASTLTGHGYNSLSGTLQCIAWH